MTISPARLAENDAVLTVAGAARRLPACSDARDARVATGFALAADLAAFGGSLLHDGGAAADVWSGPGHGARLS